MKEVGGGGNLEWNGLQEKKGGKVGDDKDWGRKREEVLGVCKAGEIGPGKS